MNKKLPLIIVGLLLLVGCANIGHPTGGDRDRQPPRYVNSNPKPGAKNVKSTKFTVFFDENIQLDDPSSKVSISPVQKEMPELSANGKRLDINLRDTLLPNTTYTLDLANAVKDLNEGNILDGFALDFSTGDSIDTLQISGMVLRARDLEPAQGMLLGVYSTPNDSNILSRPFERIARTNQLGQFTVRNLAPGNYQLYALNDLNRDYFWDRTEDVAFSSVMLSPVLEVHDETDTISEDSVVTKQIKEYLPNNVLLTWFNEEYKAQYLKNYNRPERHKIELEMAAPADSLPELTIVTLNADTTLRIPLTQAALLTHSATKDTLTYWLRDSAFIKADTMLIETRYRRVDTLDNLVWQTDTLKFNFRDKKKKEEKKSKKEKVDSTRLGQPERFLDFQVVGGIQDLNRPLQISFPTPIDSLPGGAIRVEYNPDSLYVALDPQPVFYPSDTISHTRFQTDVKWTPGGNYRLVADSLAITDITGLWTKHTEVNFSARLTEDYSSVRFNIANLPDSVQAVVELLNESDNPVREVKVTNGSALFDYLMPATYYARLYIDSDSSGTWTNGNLKLRLQPEDVYYFSKKLSLKKNWDRTEDWNLTEQPADLQKPLALKKNKPKKAPADEYTDEDEEIDPDDLPYDPYQTIP